VGRRPGVAGIDGYGQALGSQYGVVGVMGARRRRSGSWSGFVDQDGPVVVEELDDIAGLVVLQGVEVLLRAWGEVSEVVGGEEQGAPGRDGVQ
jgi:hypothetical protein